MSGVPAWVWICAIAAVIVFVAIMYSVIAFRPDASVAAQARSAMRELVWATVPIVIVIAAATPAMSDHAHANTGTPVIAAQVANHATAPCITLAAVQAASVAVLPQISSPCSHR